MTCNGNKCSILPKKFRKAKTKFSNAGANVNIDANADTEMPVQRFPNGRNKETELLQIVQTADAGLGNPKSKK